MPYFSVSQDALTLDELGPVPDTEKPIASQGDSLSFDNFEDRRFEILAYKLTAADVPGPRVRLMSGVRDKGRDIIVYSDAGKAETIKQCKNYRDRIDAPQVLRELLKLAFHSYMEPTILGPGPVGYELWCPGGLYETAEKLFFEWPTGWTEGVLRAEGAKVLRQYVAFESLTWDAAKRYVIDEFPRIVKPSRLNAIDIAGLVKKHPLIFEEFFQAVAVFRKDDLRALLSEYGLTPRTQSSPDPPQALTDDYARHVLERIKSFPPEQRMVVMSSVILGLTHPLVSKLRRAEYVAFVNVIVESTYGLHGIIMNSCARIQLEACEEFRARVRPSNGNLVHVLGKVLRNSMIARLNTLMLPTLKLQPGLEAYDALTLDQRLEQHIGEIWDELQRCLIGYDSTKHAEGSEEELRNRVARIMLDGFTMRSQLEGSLRADVVRHRRDIKETFDNYMALVPTRIILISDTVSIFEDEWLFQRDFENSTILAQLRGSPIIPE